MPSGRCAQGKGTPRAAPGESGLAELLVNVNHALICRCAEGSTQEVAICCAVNMRTAGHDELAEMLEEEDSSCRHYTGIIGQQWQGDNWRWEARS